MRLLLASVLILMLATSPLAISSTVNAGPYTINLDLETAEEPGFKVSTDVGSDSTTYLTNIRLNNQTVAALGITSYNEPQYSGFASTRTKNLLMNSLSREGQIEYPSLTEMTIDDSTAEVMSYWDPQLSQNITIAEYWKDSEIIEGYGIPAGKTKVEILSKLSGDTNENLLDSLSIEMPAQAMASRPATTTIPSGMSNQGREENIIVDQKCMQNWLDVGYTPAMIISLGWCVPS